MVAHHMVWPKYFEASILRLISMMAEEAEVATSVPSQNQKTVKAMTKNMLVVMVKLLRVEDGCGCCDL
eukprot:jgi/Picsp_1/4659/NSC_02029-R1_---NA---